MSGSPTESPNPTPPAPPESPWRFAWLCLWILPLALSWDFFRFLSTYHFFHERALAGVEQLTAPPDTHEVIVVLTGDMGRIPRSLELLRVRGSAELIISGAAKGVGLTDLVNQQGASSANLRAIWKKITLESKSSSTVENALFSREVMKDRPVGRILLVTSDYHMGRSLAVFRSVFPQWEIIPYSVASTFSGVYGLHFFWKTGAEYWKGLVYRLSLFLGMNRGEGQKTAV